VTLQTAATAWLPAEQYATIAKCQTDHEDEEGDDAISKCSFKHRVCCAGSRCIEMQTALLAVTYTSCEQPNTFLGAACNSGTISVSQAEHMNCERGWPAKSMGVHPECKALQNLKPTIAALVLNGVLRFARRDGEVWGVVNHACWERSWLGGHAQPDAWLVASWPLLKVMNLPSKTHICHAVALGTSDKALSSHLAPWVLFYLT